MCNILVMLDIFYSQRQPLTILEYHNHIMASTNISSNTKPFVQNLQVFLTTSVSATVMALYTKDPTGKLIEEKLVKRELTKYWNSCWHTYNKGVEVKSAEVKSGEIKSVEGDSIANAAIIKLLGYKVVAGPGQLFCWFKTLGDAMIGQMNIGELSSYVQNSSSGVSTASSTVHVRVTPDRLRALLYTNTKEICDSMLHLGGETVKNIPRVGRSQSDAYFLGKDLF